VLRDGLNYTTVAWCVFFPPDTLRHETTLHHGFILALCIYLLWYAALGWLLAWLSHAVRRN
jgi:hypothetical protein